MRAGLRSFLFVPGDDRNKLEKASTAPADALILDLEDAVLPENKNIARATVLGFVRAYAGRAELLVRVNGTSSPWCIDDLAALEGSRISAVMLPKSSIESLAALPAIAQPIVALVETARGVEQSLTVAEDARVVRLMLGSADLAAELGVPLSPSEEELNYPRARLAMASAAASLEGPIDVVHLGLADVQGLETSTLRGKALGFAGKACIHPAQVGVVNWAFSPSDNDIARARRVVRAYAEAQAAGANVTSLDGRLVDLPVVLHAHRIIALAGARSIREQE